MIIPVKCFTCGNVLANKYIYYVNVVSNRKQVQQKENTSIQYFSDEYKDKSIEGEVLDDLELKKQCCRRHMLTHVDIF
tara:strand:+ start:120 stop:353 length:234 start_codon:yes stop_codon:yes gene_type:complete